MGISEARVAFSTNVYYEHHLAAEASVVNRVIARVFALARYKGIGKVPPIRGSACVHQPSPSP